jgi:thioredoxin-related protein
MGSKLYVTTLFLGLLTFTFIHASPKNNILIKLNNENWKTLLDEHQMILVLFHSSDCAYSIALKEELEHLKKLLDFQNSKVDLAELDVYDYQPIMRNMGVKGEVPFVSFFFDGKPHIYNNKYPSVGFAHTS